MHVCMRVCRTQSSHKHTYIHAYSSPARRAPLRHTRPQHLQGMLITEHISKWQNDQTHIHTYIHAYSSPARRASFCHSRAQHLQGMLITEHMSTWQNDQIASFDHIVTYGALSGVTLIIYIVVTFTSCVCVCMYVLCPI
jgi:hypothetical protein